MSANIKASFPLSEFPLIFNNNVVVGKDYDDGDVEVKLILILRKMKVRK